MRFTTHAGDVVTFEGGELGGDEGLVAYIREYIIAGEAAGCDYWGAIDPSLVNDWEAYLTICGALTQITGQEPTVDEVPENPEGYSEEGGFS